MVSEAALEHGLFGSPFVTFLQHAVRTGHRCRLTLSSDAVLSMLMAQRLLTSQNIELSSQKFAIEKRILRKASRIYPADVTLCYQLSGV